MGLIQYLILFSAPIIGGLIAYNVSQTSLQKHIKTIIAFSGAYLLGISILHLLPEAYLGNHHVYGKYVLIGFFIQLILEQFSTGIEHGHMHVHEKINFSKVMAIMLGLSIHSLLEGIPLSTNFKAHDITHGLLYGIAIHKIPAAFALVSVLSHSTFKKSYSLLFLIIFALLTPLAATFAHYFSFIHEYTSLIMGIVSGSFLYIATTILFESSNTSHQFSIIKILAILAGVICSMLTS